MRKGLLQKPFVLFGDVLDKIVFTHVVVIGLPTVLYYWILKNEGNLRALHWVMPVLYLLTSGVVIGEAIATMTAYSSKFRRKKPKLGIIQQILRFRRRRPEGILPADVNLCDMPLCSLVVVAYLPNEQHIILDTLKYILATLHRPAGGLELVLAYNTPMRLPVEDELELLASQYPELRLVSVEGSRSKAENLNAVIKTLKGEITGILDADHRPQADCLERAWGWLQSGEYSVVQGRNVIRNYGTNFLTQMIAVEFECMYGVSHPAKSLLVDTGMFCGSNGYWRTSVLRRTKFQPEMMTEDIDATLRTLLRGHQMVHDPRIITTELAPVDLRSFWFQRKRWAQGWLEVALRYQIPLLRSSKLDGWQKAYWTMLLIYSVAFHFVALQIFPLLLGFSLAEIETPPISDVFFWSTTILTLMSGPFQTLTAWHIRARSSEQSIMAYVTYCLFIPIYCVFKNMIAIIAIYDHLIGNTEWVVTKRGLREALPATMQSLSYVGKVTDRVS
ncbi:glycosyltransferase [Alkalinema pantanalense CENA528]|uniref:glycosyltransferase n=1 Tax=Alkalinema pantanalense TaxID=1620705 RepID=UPI003D6EBF18